MQDDKVWASHASKNLEKFNLTKRKTMIQAEMRNMEEYQRKLRAVKLTSQGSGATWVNQPQEEGDLVSWSRRVAVSPTSGRSPHPHACHAHLSVIQDNQPSVFKTSAFNFSSPVRLMIYVSIRPPLHLVISLVHANLSCSPCVSSSFSGSPYSSFALLFTHLDAGHLWKC